MTEDTGHQQSGEERTAEVEPFDAVDVIRTKRDGHALADEQIDWVIDAYTRGVVAEEQMSALAMRSEERRVGKEGRTEGGNDNVKKTKKRSEVLGRPFCRAAYKQDKETTRVENDVYDNCA